MTDHRKITFQWRIAYLLLAIAVIIPVYALWPVATVQLPAGEPQRVGPVEVSPGSTLAWTRVGVTCFPDEWVLVRQTVETHLPDGSPFQYPDEGPRFNRGGACVEDNAVAWEMPRNLVIPGPFTVRFDFCTNPGQWLRERCVTTYSPEFVLVVGDYQPTDRTEGA